MTLLVFYIVGFCLWLVFEGASDAAAGDNTNILQAVLMSAIWPASLLVLIGRLIGRR